MKDLEYKIYTLAHPLTNEIRYVGFTTQLLPERMSGHLTEARQGKSNTHKTNWVNSLLREGLKPKIELLELASEHTWVEAEIYWIAQFKAWGFRLVNLSDGGDKTRLGCPMPEGWVNHNVREISQYSLDGEYVSTFPTATIAAKEVGSHKTSIGRSALSHDRTAGGFQWRFGASKDPITPWEGRVCRTIFQYSLQGEFIKEWPTAPDAGRALGFASTNIFKVLNGERTSCGGFLWKYGTDSTIPEPKKGERGLTKRTVVKDTQTNELHIFPTAVQAAKHLGITNKALWAYINSKAKNPRLLTNKQIYYE